MFAMTLVCTASLFLAAANLLMRKSLDAGGTTKSLVAEAEVSLGPDPAGGLRLTGIKLTVRGQVEGLDADGFLKAAQTAKETCPVSKALTGVEITLDAALA